MGSIEHEVFDLLKRRGVWTKTSDVNNAGSVCDFYVGPGDDAAVIPWSGRNLVVSTDLLTERVDFLLEQAPPELVGRKALAVNLSDLAAMASVPRAFTVSLAIPKQWPSCDLVFGKLGCLEYLERMLDGMLRLAGQFSVELIGGDTNTYDGPMVISICIFGSIPEDSAIVEKSEIAEDSSIAEKTTVPGVAMPSDLADKASAKPLTSAKPRLSTKLRLSAKPWTRHAAIPGDVLMVTGPLGGSRLRHQFEFTPRVREALYLRKHYPIHAAMDISDGLILDLSRLADQSNIGFVLDPKTIPIHPDAHLMCQNELIIQNETKLHPMQEVVAPSLSPLERAFYDGEDFELLLTMSEITAEEVLADKQFAELFQTALVPIGRACVEPGIWQIPDPPSSNPLLIPVHGFEH